MTPGEHGRQSASAPLSRRLRAAFTDRLGYKAASLFFAAVLWLVVRAEEPSEELVPVRLAAEVDGGRELVDPAPPIRALIVGRARELIKLYRTPPVVRRAIPADAPNELRIELRPSDVFLPAGVDAVVRDVQPRAVTLSIQEVAKRGAAAEPSPALATDSAAAADSARRDTLQSRLEASRQ